MCLERDSCKTGIYGLIKSVPNISGYSTRPGNITTYPAPVTDRDVDLSSTEQYQQHYNKPNNHPYEYDNDIYI